MGKLKRGGEGKPRKTGDKVLTCDRTKNGHGEEGTLIQRFVDCIVRKSEDGKTERLKDRRKDTDYVWTGFVIGLILIWLAGHKVYDGPRRTSRISKDT